MSLDCGRRRISRIELTLTRREHARSTQIGPGKVVEWNSGPSCCDLLNSLTDGRLARVHLFSTELLPHIIPVLVLRPGSYHDVTYELTEQSRPLSTIQHRYQNGKVIPLHIRNLFNLQICLSCLIACCIVFSLCLSLPILPLPSQF